MDLFRDWREWVSISSLASFSNDFGFEFYGGPFSQSGSQYPMFYWKNEILKNVYQLFRAIFREKRSIKSVIFCIQVLSIKASKHYAPDRFKNFQATMLWWLGSMTLRINHCCWFCWIFKHIKWFHFRRVFLFVSHLTLIYYFFVNYHFEHSNICHTL